MEKQELRALFESIKKDDLRSFSSIMLSNSDLNICFGRFPILSLCYLYGSYKILHKYEKLLFGIHNFNVVDEYYEIYLKFKKHAKKSLKIFVFKERIVYPIEMLAVLDERILLRKYYKVLYKNEEIELNLQKIYNLNKKINIETNKDEIKIEKKKVSLKQILISILCVCLMLLVSATSLVSFVFVKNKFGVGTALNPIKISTEAEFKSALNKGSRCYVLQNDIELTSSWSLKNFKGAIYGNSHKLVSNGYLSDGLIENLTGVVQDLTIEIDLKQKEISQNFAVLAKKSSGLIQNCKIVGDFSFETYNDSDVYVSLFVAENTGVVEGCAFSGNVEVKNNRSANAFFSVFAGVNSGTISNSKTLDGKIETDTVDVAAITTVNNGTIEGCVNNVSISQTSSKEWHPNTAGVCVSNFGMIENCTNKNQISSISTLSQINEGETLAVICGGIVCDNSGFVDSCQNKGKIVAKGDVALVYAGGVAARNLLESNYPNISKSKSECEINVYSKSSEVYVGGVAGFNASEVESSGFVGTIDAVTDSSKTSIVAYVGGVIGYNRECKLENNYSKVVFKSRDKSKDNMFFGSVAGFVGSVRDLMGFPVHGLSAVSNNHYVIDASFDAAAYGMTVSSFTNMVIGYNAILSDTETFVAHEKFEDISVEALADGQ